MFYLKFDFDKTLLLGKQWILKELIWKTYLLIYVSF